MEKLKVVHVYKSFNVYNGLIEILTILAQNLDHERYELGAVVYEYQENSFGKRFQELGGKIFDLKIPQKFYNEPKALFSLYDFFRKYRPHIVQTHVLKANLYGTMAARMAGVPVVMATEMTLKNIAHSQITRFRDSLMQPVAGYFIDRCDKFMVTSEFIKQQWRNSGNEGLFEVIYPPFNIEKYDEAVRVPRKITSSLGKRVGFVGRLSEEKGIDVLLRAMKEVLKEVPDADLTIVGTGPQEQELRGLSKMLGLSDKVIFTGYRSNSFEALREMDLFVLPSRTEGCPIVILEAMAMGLPVVATDVGGNPELLIDGKTGILVPSGDHARMAEAIIKLITGSEELRQMGQNGRKRAFSQFHPSSFTSKLQLLYRQLYDEKKEK
ncbi:MAG: glycosyltransferase family 4 protein [Fibrobacter sp.]|nr:glycosyltransferase family 4 protein [Fibrobacter sp.]